MISVPLVNFTLQDLFLSGHFSPAGELVTEPRLFLLILRLYFGNFLKAAFTAILPVGLMWQMFPSGAWHPVHRMNSYAALGVAVSLADEKGAVHCLLRPPQEIPAGSLLITPFLGLLTLTGYLGSSMKLADADFLPSIVILQFPVPEQAPFHPTKAKPLSGWAIRETFDPSINSLVHLGPQSIPVGILVIAPPPVFLTDRNCQKGFDDPFFVIKSPELAQSIIASLFCKKQRVLA